MAAPVMTHTGQRLLDALAPFADEDAANGYALAVLLSAFATGWDRVGDLARDQADGTPGYAVMFDPDECPAWLLPFAAQFVGVQMLPGSTVAQQRLRYRETDGTRRGTPWAMIGAARQFLVGPDGTGATATVYVLERVGGSAYHFSVASLVSETPDPAAVLRALLDQKPAGLVMDYATIAGGDWTTLRTTHTDWADVNTPSTTWAAVRVDPAL